MSDGRQGHRVIVNMRHGGHAIADDASQAQRLSATGWTRLSEAVQDPGARTADSGTTDFRFLFDKLISDTEAHLPSDGQGGELTRRTVLALNDLGVAMVEQEPAPDVASSIPPIYTYWGQFIDHDLTAATDRDEQISIRDAELFPLPAHDVVNLLTNARHPALNLDSLYGEGPGAAGSAPGDDPGTGDDPIVVPYDADAVKLVLGQLTPLPVAVRVPPVNDFARDLPRRADRKPRIGDGRNDENLIVAQLHVAFLRYHNEVVDWVRANESDRCADNAAVFARAQQLTRWTYQYLTVNDYLATVLKAGALERAVTQNADLLDAVAGAHKVFVPVEFAVAAFRFGHSMIRGRYDWNRNFGRPLAPDRFASLQQLFQFTGAGGMVGNLPSLPANWPVQWERFVDKDSEFPDRFARRIDTLLAEPLSDMINQQRGEPPAVGFDIRTLLKHLARRNLLRGFRLDLPTGQAVAAQLGVTALTPAEIEQAAGPAVAAVLKPAGFLEKTPLWYYILLESQRSESGETLGEVGSRIVALTIVGQLIRDQESYLHQGGSGAGDPARMLSVPPGGVPVRTIADMLRFAKVM